MQPLHFIWCGKMPADTSLAVDNVATMAKLDGTEVHYWVNVDLVGPMTRAMAHARVAAAIKIQDIATLEVQAGNANKVVNQATARAALDLVDWMLTQGLHSMAKDLISLLVLGLHGGLYLDTTTQLLHPNDEPGAGGVSLRSALTNPPARMRIPTVYQDAAAPWLQTKQWVPEVPTVGAVLEYMQADDGVEVRQYRLPEIDVWAMYVPAPTNGRSDAESAMFATAINNFLTRMTAFRSATEGDFGPLLALPHGNIEVDQIQARVHLLRDVIRRENMDPLALGDFKGFVGAQISGSLYEALLATGLVNGADPVANDQVQLPNPTWGSQALPSVNPGNRTYELREFGIAKVYRNSWIPATPRLHIGGPIAALNIARVEELKSGAVYELHGTDRSRLAIKIEPSRQDRDAAANRQLVQRTAMVMHAADTPVEIEIMADAEATGILQFARDGADPNQPGGCGHGPCDCSKLRAVMEAAAPAWTWTKMSWCIDLVDLGQAFAQRTDPNEPSRDAVRRFAAALNADGGFERVGRIIAADAFNANSDRFVFSDRGTVVDIRNKPVRLRRLLNIGNVMIARDVTGHDRPIGLDPYDPWSNEGDWSLSFDDLRGENNGVWEWSGLILQDTARPMREQMAADCAHDIDTLLGPHHHAFGRLRGKANVSRIDARAADRIVVGIEQGAVDIRAALKRVWGDEHLPVGLKDRLNGLHWLRSADYAKYKKKVKPKG